MAGWSRPHLWRSASSWQNVAITFLVSLLLGGCGLIFRSAAPSQEILTPEDAITVIKGRVASEMARVKIPGFAMVVVEDQSILWEQYTGWANVEHRVPVVQETVFRVGSISKVLTALEIMRMRDEGLIDLDVPIETYLPEFEIQRTFESGKEISVRSLLVHRSGLPRNGTLPVWYWDPGAAVLRELVDSLGETYAAYPPWTRYKYSNIGYVLLGRIIEKVRRRPWPDYMKRELLDPIGMVSSAFLLDRLPRGSQVATGYFPIRGANVAGADYDTIYMPSGNLYASARDLAELEAFIFREGVTSEGQLIESETLTEMFDARYASAADPQTNALAWFTDATYFGEQAAFHSGTNEGTISIIALLPARHLGIVAIANSDAFEEIQVQFAFDALDALRQGLCGEHRSASDVKAPAYVRSEGDPSRFAGTYIVDSDRLDIIQADDGLAARVQGFRLPLTPLSPNHFQVSHPLLPGGTVQIGFADELGAGAIVTLGNSFAIYSPRYPLAQGLPSNWAGLLGEYEVHPRYRSRYSEADLLRIARVTYEDGILAIRDEGKFLLPLDETTIRIVGGIFDGEIMLRDPDTGIIEWASFRYVPCQ